MNSKERNHSLDSLHKALNEWLFEDKHFKNLDEIQKYMSSSIKYTKEMNVSSSSESKKRKEAPTKTKIKNKKRKRKGGLKEKSILLNYFLHVNRSPSQSEKMNLVEQTGNSLKQVTDWFGNARRRLTF